jgi:SAM-dependent methyltransferase
MLEAEAARLREILLARDDISPLLNLGSSTRRYREVAKPHIARELFEPLRRAGVAVVHCDLKPGEGVDLVGNLLDPAMMRDLKARRFKCVLAANLLEHVRDPGAVAAACEEIVGPGGLILSTAPASYPYHADPIDTSYRPSPAELAEAFGRSRTLLVEGLAGLSYRDELRATGSSVPKALLRTALWALAAPVRPRSFASRAHRWLWCARPYRVSIALLAVRGAEQPIIG